jgi:hypothetical protein
VRFTPEAMIISWNKEHQNQGFAKQSVKASSSAMITDDPAFPACYPGAEVRQPVVKVSRFFKVTRDGRTLIHLGALMICRRFLT